MLGVFLIFSVYLLVLIFCAVAKYLISLYLRNNKGIEKPSTPKIYYINNITKAPIKKPKTDIAIKGRIIEKDKLN